MPRNCRNLAAALICLWIGGFRLAADQGVPFTVAQWTSDSISPQNAVITAVITMTQTRDGYLWLGTPDGLVRFDGERFTTYNEGNTPGLKRGSVVKLFEDSRTNLWIGTDTGEVLVVNDGQVKPIQVGHGTREGRLAAIAEDASGAVWLYTADGYLGRYLDGKVDSWQVTANYPNARRLMVADSTGTLWIGTDFVLHRLRPALAGPSEVPTIAYSSAPVPELEFLLASGRGGYWRFAAGRIQKLNEDRLVDGVDWAYPWNPRLTPVRAACEDQEGNLVVGTGGQGVFLFDNNGGHIQLTETNGLSSTNILSLCLDHHGELWVGTDGRGLNRVRRKSFDVFEKSSGLTAQSVCDDGQGGLWVGYFGPHIDHLGTNGVETFGRTNQLVDLGVKSVLVDHDRNLWVGTRLGGLLTLQSGRFVKAPGSGPLEHDFEISALYEDREHGLWAGAQAGLAHWDGRVWALDNRIAPSVVVRAILEDTSSNLWVGTQGAGLVELRPGQAITYGKTNGLPSENISCLYQDSAGVIWAGTPVGLARLQGAQWISYAGHFSGASGNVGYLIDDEQGWLWMGSGVGLMRARKADLEDFALGRADSVPVRAYGQPDGLPTRVCSQGSQPAACRTSDGRLWLPTISGLVSVDPRQLRPNTNAPPVLIESIWVDGKLEGRDALRASVPRSVVIPAAKQSLDIHYTGINLPAPDLGLFKYRLKNHEKYWTMSEPQRRYVHYSKLPHGDYTFEITACNEDGLWSDTPATVAITVLPPFWQTGWFMTVTTLFLLGLVVGSVHFVSTQKLQRQVAALRQQEMLEKERARIARDLHDQLGANLTQVALLGEMAETDKELPDEVEAHARQISQTARETTRALDEIVWTVNPSNDTLDGLINYICKYAQEYLALADLRYRLEVPPELPAVPIPPELRHNVFLAAKEAVNNVVKHSGANSAWVRLRLNPAHFTLEIEDNGRGLPSGAENKGRNGLRNMRKRLEELGGSFSIGPGHNGGTMVQLVAPLRDLEQKDSTSS